MDQTPLSDKIRIIAESRYHPRGKNMDNFFLCYDLGAPLCVIIDAGGATANDIGVEWIEQAWEGFCEVMQIDKYGKYDDWWSIEDPYGHE